LELNRADGGRAVNHSHLSGFYFKDRSHNSTPPIPLCGACRDNCIFCSTEQFNCAQFLLCRLSQFVLQLQPVCSYNFTINCSIYTPNNLNFIFHSNHSVCLFHHFYVVLAIGLLMLLWTVMDVTIITVKHNSQLCLYAAVLFLAF